MVGLGRILAHDVGERDVRERRGRSIDRRSAVAVAARARRRVHRVGRCVLACRGTCSRSDGARRSPMAPYARLSSACPAPPRSRRAAAGGERAICIATRGPDAVAIAVEPDRADARAGRAEHIGIPRVADHHRIVGPYCDALERRAEDAPSGLAAPTSSEVTSASTCGAKPNVASFSVCSATVLLVTTAIRTRRAGAQRAPARRPPAGGSPGRGGGAARSRRWHGAVRARVGEQAPIAFDARIGDGPVPSATS